MKATIQSAALLAVLNRVKPAAQCASKLDVLNCFHISVSSELISVSATNLDLKITAEVPCSVKKKGEVLVSAPRLLRIVSEIGNAEVDLSVDAKFSLAIKYGRNVHHLAGSSPDTFPKFDGPSDKAQSFKIQGETLKEVFTRLVPFASTDETKYNLGGLCLEGGENGASLIATDGRMLRQSPIIADVDGSFILPSEMVKMVAGLCEPGEDVDVAVEDGAIAFKAASWGVDAKLIDSTYPKWRQVVPSDEESDILISGPVATMIQAVRRAEASVSDTVGSIQLTLGDECTVKAVDSDNSSGELHAEEWTATQPLVFAVHPPFFRTMMRSFPSENQTFRAKSERHAIWQSDSTGVAVVMPMRIS